MIQHRRFLTRRGRLQARRFVLGVFVSLSALFVYIPASPLRTYALAVERNVERTIGSKGWQPDARAFLFHVPFFHQEHALSCEVASLRSALAGVNVRVTERELWNKLRKDTTPKRMVDGTVVWGNPNWGYVGNVDGRMPGTGYGVHAPPVKLLASEYAFVKDINVRDAHAIDQALNRQHPVIAWTVIGTHPYAMTWRTPFGRWIAAAVYEHTVVVIGYRGSPDAMEGVYVLDPLSSIRYETWDEFLTRTAFFDHAGLEIAPR